MLFVSQMIVAEVQDVNPAFSGPNDCEGVRRPLIQRIFSLSRPAGSDRCGGIADPAKPRIIARAKKNIFEVSPEQGICCGPQSEDVEKRYQRIKIK